MAEQPAANEPVSLEAILEVVYIYFDGDRTRVNQWLKSPHPDLDNIPPLALIQRGKSEKLITVIRSLLNEIERR